MRVKDSEELAWRDWANSADYDEVTTEDSHDYWPRVGPRVRSLRRK